ncbi:LPXTG cell wall anchor domain-containing protein [Vagococcus fluvialis]|uniref:LPXTG cell wall anchor domain-containing protein n=1 Tax=Vagococcus fluvialis TaxID=2738 RepID=UPI003B5B5587
MIVKEADTIISKNFLEMTKNDISFNIKKMYEDKLLTEKEMNDLLNRLSQVTTREDAEAILDEAKKISDNYFLEMIKNDISFNIKKMYEDKLLTEKEMNDLLNRLSQVTTREEAEAILDEAKKISDNYFLEMTKNDISFNIKKMYEDKLLTEKEMNDFLNRLSQVTTREEAEAILSEAKKLSDSKELTKGAFADKYINIKTQIELLIKNGDLTKEQGSSFLEKVEKAKTVEELDTIWQEVEKQVETNKKATTSSTEKETKKDSKTTNQLPKTGESKINIGLVSIGFVLILSFVVIIFKSRKFNN